MHWFFCLFSRFRNFLITRTPFHLTRQSAILVRCHLSTPRSFLSFLSPLDSYLSCTVYLRFIPIMYYYARVPQAGGGRYKSEERGRRERRVGAWTLGGLWTFSFVLRLERILLPCIWGIFHKVFCEHSFINNACSDTPISSQFCVNCVPSNLVADSV